MRSAAAMLVAAAVVLTASNAYAQAKTNFAGTWVREAPAGGGAAAGGGGGGGGRGGGGGGGVFTCGGECTITQDAKALTVTTENQQGKQQRTIMLDGTDTKFEMPGRQGGAATPVVAKAKWDGAKLVITRSVDNPQGTPVTATQTLSIDAGKLTVVTNSGREGATPMTATYTKKG
jgi:hypothetical protein